MKEKNSSQHRKHDKIYHKKYIIYKSRSLYVCTLCTMTYLPSSFWTHFLKSCVARTVMWRCWDYRRLIWAPVQRLVWRWWISGPGDAFHSPCKDLWFPRMYGKIYQDGQKFIQIIYRFIQINRWTAPRMHQKVYTSILRVITYINWKYHIEM